MPKCAGRPEDGLCPDHKNDASVHNTIADLFLCDACEDYRWPALGAKPKKLKVKPAAPRTTNATAKASKGKKPSKTGIGTDISTVGDAETEVLVAKGASSDLSPEVDEGNCCSVCLDTTHANLLNCDICDLSCHGFCAGLPDEVVSKLLQIIKFTGWVCADCRRSSSQKIEQLQTALSVVTEQLSDVMSTVDKLQQKLANVDISRSYNQVDSINVDNTNVTKATTTDIAVEIHRTLVDVSKRKQNVVVTGLPESQHITDEQAFLNLCEENFSFKPTLSHVGCRRLGKISDQHKSRKLLIHLKSEETANSILCEAKKLRHSNDPAVSSTVYINPDRSPAESKLAFEMRQQKRQRRAELASKMSKQWDHPNAPPPVLAGNNDLPSGVVADAVTDFVGMSANANVLSDTVVHTPFRGQK